MAFEVQQGQIENKPLLTLIGDIDEEAVFPTLTNLSGEVYLDLKAVYSINSIGIRAWIMWFGEMESLKFIFLNCPKALVMQMNMVDGFLPQGAQVQSLQVPFYCENCDEEKDIVFRVGDEIQIQGGQVQLKYNKSAICGEGCEPELDVNESKYFRFLINGSRSQAA